MSKTYTTRFKYDQVECLEKLIGKVITETTPNDDDDKMLFGVLAEVKSKLYLKMRNPFTDCTMSFRAYEAFALRILFTDYHMDFTTYIGAKLLVMSNEIHEKFNN